MATPGLTSPRSNVDRQSGSGLYNPTDKEFQKIRLKAKAVLDGRDSFTYRELCQVLARLITER